MITAVMNLLYTTTDDQYKLSKAHEDDAGFDLVSSEFVELHPGEQATISTPFCVAIPRNHVGLVMDRSGIASNRVYTHGGVIDCGYHGIVKVILENCGSSTVTIEPGDRIAQLIVVQLGDCESLRTYSLPDSERGSAGFGSTGK